MSAVASTFVNPDPPARLAPPAEMLARLDGADHLVSINHWIDGGNRAVVTVIDGPRRHEVVAVPRESLREDSAVLMPAAPADGGSFPFWGGEGD